ncbi:hypothetical protein R3P38DRAFT_1862162 [Favolaschia claudopus]|uniref:Uncharacterized protein n=1 Tax=Favolaschia claudopus TaxID=2862362 RepID=A0AAW0DAW2_9AGAR
MPPPSCSISPSTSPAHKSFFPSPYRIPHSSPSKPQRPSSQPSTSANPQALDESVAQGAEDWNVGAEREASALRMLDVWSQLANKYVRRIDEDDLVDIVTGELVKDRGILEGEATREFPSLSYGDEASSAETEEDLESDFDELDAFRPHAAETSTLRGWTVPPQAVREVDPADARDLKEFMEAEKRRKEECSDEGSEENQDDENDVGANHDDVTDDTIAAWTPPPAPLTAEMSESEDELNNWDVVDESNLISPARSISHPKTENRAMTSSPVPPASNVSSSSPKKPIRRQRSPGTKLQLETPPPSRTPDELSSPSSSPFPVRSPRTRSFTKRKTTPGIPDRSGYEVRTRSQSRAESSELENNERLFRGGRDMSLQSSRFSATQTRGSSHRSTHNLTSSSASANPPGTSGPSSDSGVSAHNPHNTPRRSSRRVLPPASTQLSTFLGDEDSDASHCMSGPSSRDRKGKGRAVEVQGSTMNDGQGRQFSNDPHEFMHSKQRSKPHLPRPPSTPSRDTNRKNRSISDNYRSTPKKRKRSSSLDSEDAPRHPQSNVAQDPSHLFDSPPPMQNHASTLYEPEQSSHSASSELEPEHSHQMPQYNPSPFYPYPPFPVPPVAPIQDPRAQIILAQAMQQLSALFTPWSTPFTNQPRQSSSVRTVASGPSPYTYPMTPPHQHAHRHVFDSGASSIGTLPPSSPPGSPASLSDSSPLRSHGDGRRGSLVPRSHSRGRRVTFKIDEEIHQSGRRDDSCQDNMKKASTKDDALPSRRKKRKQNVVARHPDTDSDDADSIPRDEVTITRKPARAQTPGPSTSPRSSGAKKKIPRRTS